MVYYNRILRVWSIDAVDYFLLSAIVGSLAASHLKKYLSEKEARKRLANSIIKKSKLVRKSYRPALSSKKARIRKIYRLALGNRGGDLEQFQAANEALNEAFKMAAKIQGLIERLARFLKERELKGVAKIFFKNGRLLLELILCKCKIDVTYALVNEGLKTQVIVITATAGGVAGFTISWFSAGASLVFPPVLISVLLLRSFAQQIVNQIDYVKFKKMITKMLEDDEIKETLRAVFVEGEVPKTDLLEMKQLDSNKSPLPEYEFDVPPDQTLDEFIKEKIQKEFGLIDNPTEEQIHEIVKRRKTKTKGKTVYFKDFINEIAEGPNDIIDAEIIDAEIVQEPSRVKVVKVRNDEL